MSYELAFAAIQPGGQHEVPLPEFVPLEKFGEFLLAAKDSALQESHYSRRVSEALTAKFTENSDPSGVVGSFVLVPQSVVDAQSDPKAQVQLIAFAKPGVSFADDPKGSKIRGKIAKRKPVRGVGAALAKKRSLRVKHQGKLSDQIRYSKSGIQKTPNRQAYSASFARKASSQKSSRPGQDAEIGKKVGFVDVLVNPTPWN